MKLSPLIISLALAARAAAADLDAPATKPVTVRTEIARGIDAMKSAPMGDPLGHQRFIDALLSANQQRNTDSDGFKFGVYHTAWHDSWQVASIGLREKTSQQLAEISADLYYLFTTSLAKSLELDQDQIRQLTWHYVPGEETLFPQIVKSKQFKGTYISGARMKPSTEVSGADKK